MSPRRQKRTVVDTVQAAYAEAAKATETLLLSTHVPSITRAFSKLLCLVQGSCLKDLGPDWDSDVSIVYEFGRCLVPSRVLQLIKERHMGTSRWERIAPEYARLYNVLYEDLLPASGDLSNRSLEDQPCSSYSSPISPSLRERVTRLVQRKDLRSPDRHRRLEASFSRIDSKKKMQGSDPTTSYSSWKALNLDKIHALQTKLASRVKTKS